MSGEAERTTEPEALTALILEVFKVNGALIAAGNALVGDLGLSSARWQVMGAIAMAAYPRPIAHIARDMGLSRQAVRRVVRDLAREGIVRFAPNPHHMRADLVLLTPLGQTTYAQAMERQQPWAAGLSCGLSAKEIERATRLLSAIRKRLEHPDARLPKRDQEHTA